MPIDGSGKTQCIGLQINSHLFGVGICLTECILGLSWHQSTFVIHLGPIQIIYARC